MRNDFERGNQSCREGRNLRDITLFELLSRINHIEVNRDRVIGKAFNEPHGATSSGEGTNKLSLFRLHVFGGGLITAYTAVMLAGTSKNHSDE